MTPPVPILYEDNHLLVVNKRVSDIVHGDQTGDVSLDRLLKDFIKERDHKPGEVFLGIPHRLDRPVSGAVIFIANGIWHAAICVMTRSYVPGVVTGMVLYVPLGCLVMYRLWHFMTPRLYIVAVVIGMLIHAAVIWFVLQMPGFQMG